MWTSGGYVIRPVDITFNMAGLVRGNFSRAFRDAAVRLVQCARKNHGYK
jgi:hypothetical protein